MSRERMRDIAAIVIGVVLLLLFLIVYAALGVPEAGTYNSY